MTPRTICWFSAGAASAVATKLTLAEHGHDGVCVAYTDPGSEHPDNARLLAEREERGGHRITRLKSEKYRDTWQVWEERRFIVSPQGALCTAELKKRVRYGFERPTDVQVFGYTADEIRRADRFRDQNPGVELDTPLIRHGLDKGSCLALVERAGITLPAMYLLGYQNNNCIGCPKGGIGYWNKIRRDFPDQFARMATLERDIGHSVLSDEHGPIWLDELDPARGNHQEEPSFDCSLMCVMVEGLIGGAA